MGFFNTYQPKKYSYRRDLCDYRSISSCCCEKKKLNKIQKSWQDFSNYCGKFSIPFYESNHQQHLASGNNLINHLINLQKINCKIECAVCSHKFELRKKGNEISIYKYKCCTLVGESCLYCYQMEKKKYYSQCKKCQFNLLFFPNTYDQHIKCERCSLQHCIYCKNSKRLFTTKYCKCRLSSAEKKIKFLQVLLMIDIIIAILGIVFVSYFEENEYFQSIKCSVKNWFSDSLCTSDQFSKDLIKLGIIMAFYILYFIITISFIELIQQLNKQSSKFRFIKANREVYWLGRRFNFKIS